MTTEDARKTPVCHLKTQRIFQHITIGILRGNSTNKRISRRPPPINLLENQSYICNVDIPRLLDRKADVISTLLKKITIAAITESYPEPECIDMLEFIMKNLHIIYQ